MMSTNKVYILGGQQTDFSVNWSKQHQSIFDLLKESFQLATDQCKVNIEDIQSAHVGNFVGELFCGQGQLGGLFTQIDPALVGIPTARHEAACASGSMAVFAGMREIEAGWYDLVAVSGIEMMRNVDGKTASEYLGVAAWTGMEAKEANYPWVYLFSEIREFYQERYGVKDEHLAAIAKINYANARRNPNAQSRKWELDDRCFENDDTFNPIIEGCLRKSDCGRITDGAATIFLASEKYAKEYAENNGRTLDSIPHIKGWGHRTAQMALKDKFEMSVKGEYAFPQLRNAITDAYKRAKITNALQLDAIETHDCFTISEYVALEHLGLAAPGEAWKVIEDNSIAFQGKLPVNPSGGLIGMGHPVGATGVRMLLDAYKQVSGTAGEYQVEQARNVGILNIGGSFTTVASFVVGC